MRSLMRVILVLVSVVLTQQIIADEIVIHNVSEKPVYVAVYKKSLFSDKVKRVGGVVLIDPLAFDTMSRPSMQLKKIRYITVSLEKSDLEHLLSKERFEQLCSIGIGSSNLGRVFNDFYVAYKHNRLKLYSPATLKLSDIKYTIAHNLEKALEAQRYSLIKHSLFIKENPYNIQKAAIRVSRQLCDQEKEYLENRTKQVKKALEQFLAVQLNGSFVPKIALINSGGGIRALISSTGFHMGAQDAGLLDAITYDVGLSGGAWFLALWMYSGLDIYAFKDMIEPLVQKDLLLRDVEEAKLFAESLVLRYGLKQSMTLVNWWGALLANRYLAPYGDKRHQLLWSDIAERVKKGHVPLPILCTTSGNFAESTENRPKIPWYECTPFEVGAVGHLLGDAFVPTWAFGREYNNLISVDTNPAYDLGLIMGMCGSAFAFSFARGYEKGVKKLPIMGTIIEALLSQASKETIGKKRITVGKVYNFAKGYKGIINKDDQYLKMVDAGIAFNLPYPPVSGHGARKADVYIFCDASSNIEKKGPDNLHMIEQYAREHNLKFPIIDTKRLTQQVISVFKDEIDPTVPLVIYIPRSVIEDVLYPSEVPVSFSTKFSTLKFAYSKKEFDALSAVTRTNMKQSAERIKQELLDFVKRNGGF